MVLKLRNKRVPLIVRFLQAAVRFPPFARKLEELCMGRNGTIHIFLSLSESTIQQQQQQQK